MAGRQLTAYKTITDLKRHPAPQVPTTQGACSTTQAFTYITFACQADGSEVFPRYVCTAQYANPHTVPAL